MSPELSRRKFIKVGLYGSATLFLPVGCGGPERNVPSGDGRFFDDHQHKTIKALVDVIIPEDDDPGADLAGVGDYIDYLLGAFTVDPPRIYAAGPTSGRHGGANDFEIYLPLSRVKEIAWRNTIEGSQGIPEREFNGPVKGYQEIYIKGIEALDALSSSEHGVDFKDLDARNRKRIFQKTDREFHDIVFDHTVEGMYAAPEYGGNRDCAGWSTIHYEGDRQPVGYSRREVEELDEDTAADLLGHEEAREAMDLLQNIFARRKALVLKRITGGG